MKTRLLALASLIFTPYVAVRFPRELGGFLREVFKCIATGRTSLDWARNVAPSIDGPHQETAPG